MDDYDCKSLDLQTYLAFFFLLSPFAGEVTGKKNCYCVVGLTFNIHQVKCIPTFTLSTQSPETPQKKHIPEDGCRNISQNYSFKTSPQTIYSLHHPYPSKQWLRGWGSYIPSSVLHHFFLFLPHRVDRLARHRHPKSLQHIPRTRSTTELIPEWVEGC